MKPLVSIITPTYNHEIYIKKCIDSVLSQTFSDWEQIIIDDASTDRTPEIVEYYAKKDKRIKFIRHKINWGPYRLGETYNEALKYAQGDLIAILEGDDWWPENRLNIQVQVFEDKHIILSYGDRIVVDQNGKKIEKVTPRQVIRNSSILENNPPGKILLAYLFGKFPTFNQTVMIKKSVLFKIGGFVTKSYIPTTDWPTYILLSMEGRFHYVPQILGYFRRHENAISFNKSIEILKGIHIFTKEIIPVYKSYWKRIGIPVNKILITQLELIEEYSQNIKYYQGMRYLRIKKWELAKEKFLKFLKDKKVSTKSLMACIGVFSCFLHFNIFQITKIFKNLLNE